MVGGVKVVKLWGGFVVVNPVVLAYLLGCSGASQLRYQCKHVASVCSKGLFIGTKHVKTVLTQALCNEHELYCTHMRHVLPVLTPVKVGVCTIRRLLQNRRRL